jgi:hypothetical protein
MWLSSGSVAQLLKVRYTFTAICITAFVSIANRRIQFGHKWCYKPPA